MTKKRLAWARRAEKVLRGRRRDGLTWQTAQRIDVQPVCAANESNALFRWVISGRHALPLMAE